MFFAPLGVHGPSASVSRIQTGGEGGLRSKEDNAGSKQEHREHVAPKVRPKYTLFEHTDACTLHGACILHAKSHHLGVQ